MLYFIRDWASS